MTGCNCKKVSVSVSPQYKDAALALPPGLISADVAVEALPVRVIDVTDWYEGDYVVDPRFYAQVLETRNLAMHEDVTVRPIRVEPVENYKGGYTVWIGME